MPDERPNIVFILTDQMRGDALSVTGHPVVETPNLDALARRGTVFTAAYSSCPSCIAARASLFTGLSPSSHGRLGYRDCVPWHYDHMLPEVLGAAGYQTHCVGKRHFFPQWARFGFQSLDTHEAGQNFDGTYVNDYWEWLSDRTNGTLHEFDHGTDSNSWVARPSHLPEELHNNTWTVTRAIDFVRRRDKTRPFFLNISFHRPHPPIDPPAAFYDMYRDKPLDPVPIGDWAGRHDVPPDNVNCWHGHLPEQTLNRCRRAYYAQIAHIDNQIGRFLIAIRKLQPGPIMFVFTSDHGEMLGDHHMFRKVYAYEGAAKVPLIICPPTGSAEHVCPAPTVSEDVYSTILEAADVTLPPARDGRSLLPLTRIPVHNDWPEFVHGEHSACYAPENAMQFMTDRKTKYIWYTVTGEEQLFDLETDPQECRNLAATADEQERLLLWRRRMIERLATRPQDGLTDGTELVAGKSLPAVRPELLT